jgi:hypothetical protein
VALQEEALAHALLAPVADARGEEHMKDLRVSHALTMAIERLLRKSLRFSKTCLGGCLIAVFGCFAITPASATAQQVVAPAPIVVNTPIVTINNSPGDQTVPHVSGDLVSYSDIAGASIRYYTFNAPSITAEKAPVEDVVNFGCYSSQSGGQS